MTGQAQKRDDGDAKKRDEGEAKKRQDSDARRAEDEKKGKEQAARPSFSTAIDVREGEASQLNVSVPVGESQ